MANGDIDEWWYKRSPSSFIKYCLESIERTLSRSVYSNDPRIAAHRNYLEDQKVLLEVELQRRRSENA